MSELKYDIIVAGGGSAGSAAAIAAARRGHRVLLVEEQNCLGGVSTSGLVGEWFAGVKGLGDVFDSVREEILQFNVGYNRGHFFNPEHLKIAWQQLVEQAGVDVLFHASVCGAEESNGELTRVEIACCSQVLKAHARYFIDATGEGDLCALGGAQFMLGDPENGNVLHMTLVAWMYDTGKVQTPYLPDGLKPINSREELPGLNAGCLIDDGRLYLNATKAMAHDPTDPFSLSSAEGEARRQLARITHFLQRTEYPTFALASSGATIGIREGRRILGDYILARDEILDRKVPLVFDDGIAVATSQIDFHSLTKAGNAGWRQGVTPYNIPFRCLTPKGLANVLTAGKCISADQVVHSSCRMTPTCCAMGQAAGTAAALAVEGSRGDIREIDIAALRETLAAAGVELDPAKHKPFAPQNTRLDPDDQV